MEENDLYGKYGIFIGLRKNRKNTRKYKSKKVNSKKYRKVRKIVVEN